MLVNVTALAYGVLAMINMAWPRTPDAPWYDNWLVALSAAVGVGVGAVYLFFGRPHLRSDATAGDAIPANRTPSGSVPTGEEAGR
jgi:hypothetical protein